MKTRAHPLNAQESRIVAILYNDWRNLLRCTTIDQAMERAEAPFSHDSRLRMADFLRRDPAAAKLMRWDLAAYVLTNEEKLFARLILRAAPSLGLIPDPEDLAPSGLDFSSADIPQALATLESVGFLRQSLGGYELARDHGRFLSGIGFHFHEVVLPDRRERFNTNCATDFFIMTHRPTRERALAQIKSGGLPEAAGEGMSQKMIDAIRAASRGGNSALADSADHTNERAILNDACALTHEPLGVAMDGGKITEVTPDSTWYLRGGGCGVNLLFRSEEAAQSWLTQHPNVRAGERGPVKQVFGS
jgi:hypothetical protein